MPVTGVEEGNSVGTAAWGVFATGIDVERSISVGTDGGVQVGGKWKGVVVGICREGPSGRFHTPEYSQTTIANTAIASMERKVRMIF